MGLSTVLLPEFDHEMANTRKTLERIPEDKFDWKPHEKSMSLGRLATHLVTLPSWAVQTISQSSLDVAPGGQPAPPPEQVNSQKDALERFDKNVSEARASIASAEDAQLLEPWSLLNDGKAIITLPRIAVLRSFVMNHNIHHRAQLGVYLRLNDIPVPSIYGPSADEGAF
ncbi:MAG: hypothetical protein QOJ64_2440 [Acidobacteriota bacterium]|jgi:uncharacterized damage-inducible protein DinB|nr:hypothetical protein [Acidobacteriota bacterium]